MAYREVYPIEIEQGYTVDGMCVMMMYDPKESRTVPIMIGSHEADMILLERDGASARRPMTHELLSEMMGAFNLSLKEATIDRFMEGIFYATLHVTDGFVTKKLDCRASDAITMALHENVPILMEERIIEETGFFVEPEYSEEPEPTDNMSLEEMESLLKQYEAAEEYEKAADLMKRIEELKNNGD